MKSWRSVIQQRIQKYTYFLSVFSGVLLGVSLLHPLTSGMVFLGVALTVWLVRQGGDAKQLLYFGYLSWTVKSLIGVSFMWQIYPIYWLGDVSDWIQLAVIGLNWVMVSLPIGLAGAGVWYLLSVATRLVSQRFIQLVLIASIWTGGEVFASFLFSAFFIGPGVSVGLYYSFGYVGYAVASIPGMYLLALGGGAYALSFVAVLIGQFVLDMHRYNRWLVLSLVVGVFLVLVILGKIVTYTPQGISIATIDTQFRTEVSTGPVAQSDGLQLQEAVGVGLEYQPDFLLLPEDARYFARLRASDISPASIYARFRSSTATTTIIDSTRTEIAPMVSVLRANYHQSGNIVAAFDKEYLTPQGEFISYWQQWIVQKLPLQNTEGQYFSITYQSGNNQTTDLGYMPSVMFCFEASHPLAVRNRLTADTPFVVYPISHAWFYNARTLTHQVDMMVRTHAIWNQLPIVSAANMETGKVYYPDGRIETKTYTRQGDQWVLRVFEI